MPVKREGGSEEHSKAFVRSLARGLTIVVAMGEHPAGMTLSEVATATGLDRATTRRLIMTLEQLGYVRPDGRRFLLAPRVLSLGYAYLSSMPVWAIAAPFMRELVDFTKESCAVSVYDEGNVIYISEVQSDQRKVVPTLNVAIPMNVGARLPAYCTAMGRVLLANLPGGELERYLASLEPRKFTQYTITDIGALRANIEDVAQKGWSLSNQEIEVGYLAIAVPLHDRGGSVIAALGVTAHVNRVGPSNLVREYLPRLQLAAREVEAVLRQR